MGSKISKRTLSDELSSQDIAELQASCNLNEEEIRKIYAEFKEEYPSGSITKRQYRKVNKKSTNQHINSDIVDSLFDAFDKDKNGSIDFHEYLVVYTVRNNIDLKAKLDVVFNILDKSQDGYVTYDELRNFWKRALKGTGDNSEDINFNADMIARNIFDQLGVNRNQRLNKQQFVDGCNNNEQLLAAFL